MAHAPGRAARRARVALTRARHADARHVWLRLHPGRPWRLVVEDDGRGVEAAPSPRAGGGNGLRAMEARAARIGGELRITARAGGGTVVTLTFEPRWRG
mgnify:CR=1 FL=1